MIDFPEALDLTQLIETLKRAQTKETLIEQRTEIEMALVSAELHPNSSDFVDLVWSIELLGQVDTKKRNWQPAPDQLIDFFEAESS
ncbi:MAG: hypothetical protein EBT07_09560 [Actinobacteria bacterium]|nr:hypothetical protein [Actinomycetota bacterium]